MDRLYFGTDPDGEICIGILTLLDACLAIEVRVGLLVSVARKLLPAVDGALVARGSRFWTDR